MFGSNGAGMCGRLFVIIGGAMLLWFDTASADTVPLILKSGNESGQLEIDGQVVRTIQGHGVDMCFLEETTGNETTITSLPSLAVQLLSNLGSQHLESAQVVGLPWAFVATNQRDRALGEAVGHPGGSVELSLDLVLQEFTGCRSDDVAANYNGTVSQTAQGNMCDTWEKATTKRPYLKADIGGVPERLPRAFCRNPDDYYYGPWCYYFVNDDIFWEYCDQTPRCPPIMQTNPALKRAAYQNWAIVRDPAAAVDGSQLTVSKITGIPLVSVAWWYVDLEQELLVVDVLIIVWTSRSDNVLKVAQTSVSQPDLDEGLSSGGDVHLCYKFVGSLQHWYHSLRFPCLKVRTVRKVVITMGTILELKTFHLREVEINPGHHYDIIGQETSHGQNPQVDNTPSTVIIIDHFEQAVVRPGYLVSIRAFIERTTSPVYAQIWRPLHSNSSQYKLVWQNELPSGVYGEFLQNLRGSELTEVQKGDKLGFHCPAEPVILYEEVGYNYEYNVLVKEDQLSVLEVGSIIKASNVLHRRRYHFSAHIVSLDSPWMRASNHNLTSHCLTLTEEQVTLNKDCANDTVTSAGMLKLDRFGRLIIRESLRCIDADGAYEGAEVFVEECHSLRSGVWLLHNEEGVSEIIHKESGLCLGPDAGSLNVSSTTLSLQRCSSTDNRQLWVFYNAHFQGYRDMGCYKDNTGVHMDMPNPKGSDTGPDECVRLCSAYTFASLSRNIHTSVQDCRCGMAFGRYGLLSDSLCNKSSLAPQRILQTKRHCPALPQMSTGWYEHAACTLTGRYSGDNCTLHCPRTHGIIGDATLTCSDFGNWTGSHYCLKKTCRAPDIIPPDTAIVGLPSRTYVYLNTIEYQCQLGYEPTGGDLERTCMGSDEWSGTAPICSAVLCEIPLLPENAHYSPEMSVENVTLSSVLSYVCEEFTELISGDLTRDCLPDKTWSGDLPVCQEISCSPLPEISGVVLNIRETTYQSTAQYQCDTNFRYVSGDAIRICQANKTWSGNAMVCEEIRCNTLVGDGHVIASNEGTSVGDQTHYMCSAGYHSVRGNRSRTCTINASNQGRWSGEELVCIETLCDLPAQPRLPVIMSGANNSNSSVFRVADSLRVYCQEGYEAASGSLAIECMDKGSWSSMSLVCKEKECGMPEPIDGTMLNVSGISVGDTATLSCLEDTFQAGQTVLTECLSTGSWSEVNIFCDDVTCMMITPSPSSTVNVTGTRVGDVAAISCAEGFQLSETDTMTCNSSGQWEGEGAVCEKVTCEVPLETTSIGVFFETRAVGSTAILRCKAGFRPRNVTIVHICHNDGSWVGGSLNCSEITFDAGSVDSLLKHETFEVDNGLNITFSCAEGYLLTPRTASGFYTFEEIQSAKSLECLAITCGSPPLFDNSLVTNNSTSIGSTATYTCKEGFLQTGSDSLECSEDGSWIGAFQGCEREDRVCPLPDVVAHCAINFTSLGEGATVSYSCEEHYWLEAGDQQLTCGSNFTWIGQLPVCSKSKCSQPPTVTNASWYMDTRALPDQRAIYRCLPLFDLIGGEVVKECVSNGTWDGIDPICVESGKGWEIYVPEDPPLTKHEQILKWMGYKDADKNVSNVSCGILGSLMIALSVGTIVALDCIRVKRKPKRKQKQPESY